MQPYLIAAPLFVLLFILTFYLFERYKISIQAFWAKQTWLWKIPWGPTRKIIYLWAGIIVTRKLIFNLVDRYMRSNRDVLYTFPIPGGSHCNRDCCCIENKSILMEKA